MSPQKYKANSRLIGPSAHLAATLSPKAGVPEAANKETGGNISLRVVVDHSRRQNGCDRLRLLRGGHRDLLTRAN
jgi:hypothetical protein